MDHPVLTAAPYRTFRESLRRFITEAIVPHAVDWERGRHFPGELLAEFGRRGYLGLSLPKEVGGGGKDFWHEVILAEELARSRTLGFSLSILVQSNMVAPLLSQLGTKKQCEEIVKPALRGNLYLALAVTDAGSGSDLAAVSTEAIPSGDSYVINGEKRYISNGSVAQYIVALARTQRERGVWPLGLFVISADTPGLKRERLSTVGLKTGDTAAITFEQCRVSRDNALGDVNRGFIYLLRGLQRERLVAAVALNELGLYVWEETLSFLKSRQRFGSALSEKQVIRHRMVELRTRIEAARSFTYAVCEAFASGAAVDKEVLMLKVLAFETCQDVLRECVHFHGAAGFIEDHWLSHAYQDSQAFTLAAGTAEVVRDVLAGMMKL